MLSIKKLKGVRGKREKEITPVLSTVEMETKKNVRDKNSASGKRETAVLSSKKKLSK